MSKPIEPKFPKRRHSAYFGAEMIAPDGCYLLPAGAELTCGDWSWSQGGWTQPGGFVACRHIVAECAWTYARKLPDGQQNDDLPAAEEENGMTAERRAGQMMTIPMKDLPPLAVEFARELCNELGACGEVFMTAYAVYAQCAEGLPCEDDLYRASEKHRSWFQENGIYDAAELRDLEERGTADAVRLFRETVREKATGATAQIVGPEPSGGETPPDDTETLLGLIREFTPVVLSHFSGNPVRNVALAAAMARAALEEARKGITAQPSALATVQPPHPDAPRLLMTHDGKVTAFGAIEAPPGYYLLPAGEVAEREDSQITFKGTWTGVRVPEEISVPCQFTFARKLPATEGA